MNIGFAAKAMMWDSGHGIVIMVNNWSFEAEILMRYVINAVAKEYGWSYRYTTFTPWPYADTLVDAAAKLRGPAAAIAEYRALTKKWNDQQSRVGDLQVVWASDPPAYPPNGWDLYGTAQLIGGPAHLRDAIELMKADVADYPNFAQGYRFLAVLYERTGEKALAIQALERLLALVPDDAEAAESLRKLRESGR